MKVALASDIHVEFGTIELNNTENADVLILSGDICIADDMRIGTDFGKGEEFLKFFQHCSREFPEVIYISGNHEHYHGILRLPMIFYVKVLPSSLIFIFWTKRALLLTTPHFSVVHFGLI